jgi:hypothetical protein
MSVKAYLFVFVIFKNLMIKLSIMIMPLLCTATIIQANSQ